MMKIYLMSGLIVFVSILQVQASLQEPPEEQVQSYEGFVFRYSHSKKVPDVVNRS